MYWLINQSIVMVLIGVAGKIGSGKSTVAKYLVEKYGFIEISFAEPLKKACQNLFLFNDNQVFGTQLEKATADDRWFGKSPRDILQYVGTNLLRDQMYKIIPELGKDIFIHRMELWYSQEIKKTPNINVVISDLRFPNEAEFIKKNNGICIQIDRHIKDFATTHISENSTQNIDFTYIVDNSSDLDSLHIKIDSIIGKTQTL